MLITQKATNKKQHSIVENNRGTITTDVRKEQETDKTDCIERRKIESISPSSIFFITSTFVSTFDDYSYMHETLMNLKTLMNLGTWDSHLERRQL